MLMCTRSIFGHSLDCIPASRIASASSAPSEPAGLVSWVCRRAAACSLSISGIGMALLSHAISAFIRFSFEIVRQPRDGQDDLVAVFS